MILVYGEEAEGEERYSIFRAIVFHQIDRSVLGDSIYRVVSGQREMARSLIGNYRTIVVILRHIARSLREDYLLATDLDHPVEHVESTYCDGLEEFDRIELIAARQRTREMTHRVNPFHRQDIESFRPADIHRIIFHPMISEESLVILAAADCDNVITLAFEVHRDVSAQIAGRSENYDTFHISTISVVL